MKETLIHKVVEQQETMASKRERRIVQHVPGGTEQRASLCNATFAACTTSDLAPLLESSELTRCKCVVDNVEGAGDKVRRKREHGHKLGQKVSSSGSPCDPSFRFQHIRHEGRLQSGLCPRDLRQRKGDESRGIAQIVEGRPCAPALCPDLPTRDIPHSHSRDACMCLEESATLAQAAVADRDSSACATTQSSNR